MGIFDGQNYLVKTWSNFQTSEDSPRWLVSRAKLSEAKTALAFFRGCSDVTNMSKHVECELNDMEHQMNKVIYTCSPSVLVYFTWLLNHVIYPKLRKRLLLLQAEQMQKITLSFTQNGPNILLTSSNNQIYEFRIPNILFTCLINSRARHSAIFYIEITQPFLILFKSQRSLKMCSQNH